MTKQATITEYRPVTVTVTAYAYDELSDAARANVYRTCMDTCERERLYQTDLDDIDAALSSFVELTGTHYARLNESSIWFEPVDYSDVHSSASGIDDYVGCGLWCGWDLAQAFNKHVLALMRLGVAVEGLKDKDGRPLVEACELIKAETAFEREYASALDDVAAVYQKLVNDSWDYWTDDANTREYWSECYYLYVDDRLYDVNGNDITDLVERYA